MDGLCIGNMTIPDYYDTQQFCQVIKMFSLAYHSNRAAEPKGEAPQETGNGIQGDKQ